MITKKTQTRTAVISGLVLVVILVALVVRNYDFSNLSFGSNNDTTSESEVATPNEPKATEVAEQTDNSSDSSGVKTANTDKQYSYAAEYGDSYTSLARTALADYARDNRLSLSSYDALLAEVELANLAGSPMLEVGDEVKLSTEDIVKVLPSTAVVETTSKVDEVAEEKSQEKPSTSASDNANYTYVAKFGDSYTLLARSAVSRYMSDEKVDLTAAQRLYVETTLTNAAGSPMIDVDQQIVIAKDSVKAAADTAKGLTASEQEAWASYLPTVDLS